MKPFFHNGFSLLEVLLALGLFAGVAMAMLSLWPLAEQLRNDVDQNFQATLIAQRILETLKATSSMGVVATKPDGISNPGPCLILDFKKPSVYYVAYDCAGKPRREVTAAEYQHGLREENASTLACISIMPETAPGLVPTSIIIAAPAFLRDKQRHHVEFSYLLRRGTDNEKSLMSKIETYNGHKKAAVALLLAERLKS